MGYCCFFVFVLFKLPLYRQVQSSRGKNNIILKIETVCGDVNIAKILKNNNVYILFSSLGTAEEIFYGHKHPYTWSLLNAAPNLELGHKQKLLSIEGTPPDLIHPPKGCPFAARCKFCMNVCVDEVPDEYEFEDGHKTACWLYHPESGYQNIDFDKEAEIDG